MFIRDNEKTDDQGELNFSRVYYYTVSEIKLTENFRQFVYH
jgi:hypothetical protein